MTSREFIEDLNQNKAIIDRKISSAFDSNYHLTEALIYAMEGGKRIRACAFLETMKMLGEPIDNNAISFALAIEMIQAYSLVHDDLPAMDNDMERRGRPTVHAKFGEDIGILTGDALLNKAARLLLEICFEDESYLKASHYLLLHSGYMGMIEGQILDLYAEDYDMEYLLRVYDKKTADLFKGSIVAAGFIADVDNYKIAQLEDYAYNLGLGFQIQDDLLEEDYSDELNILNITDADTANSLLMDINQRAKNAIAAFDNNDFHLHLIDYLSDRDN